MGTSLRINRLHWPVTTLGYGKRIGIWFQGCSIHCPGCCSRDTWDSEAGSDITLEALLEWVSEHPMDEIDGFTISGGEPFDQSLDLKELLTQLRLTYCQGVQRDILVYSGYPMNTLSSRHKEIIELMDVLVSEPYLRGRPIAPLRGSDNQRLRHLTTLGWERYPDNPDKNPPNNLQIHFDGTALWMIGIPKKGDLEKLQRQLVFKGITMSNVSWMA